jgi:hypothetical protein
METLKGIVGVRLAIYGPDVFGLLERAGVPTQQQIVVPAKAGTHNHEYLL